MSIGLRSSREEVVSDARRGHFATYIYILYTYCVCLASYPSLCIRPSLLVDISKYFSTLITSSSFLVVNINYTGEISIGTVVYIIVHVWYELLGQTDKS